MCSCLFAVHKDGKYQWKMLLVRQRQQETEGEGQRSDSRLHFSKQKTSSSLVLTGSFGQTNKSERKQVCKKKKKKLRCFCGGPNVFLQFRSLNTVRNKVRVTSKENCTFVLQTDWLQSRTLAYVSELLGVALTLTSETLNRWLQQRSVFCFTMRQLR